VKFKTKEKRASMVRLREEKDEREGYVQKILEDVQESKAASHRWTPHELFKFSNVSAVDTNPILC